MHEGRLGGGGRGWWRQRRQRRGRWVATRWGPRRRAGRRSSRWRNLHLRQCTRQGGGKNTGPGRIPVPRCFLGACFSQNVSLPPTRTKRETPGRPLYFYRTRTIQNPQNPSQSAPTQNLPPMPTTRTFRDDLSRLPQIPIQVASFSSHVRSSLVKPVQKPESQGAEF